MEPTQEQTRGRTTTTHGSGDSVRGRRGRQGREQPEVMRDSDGEPLIFREEREGPGRGREKAARSKAQQRASRPSTDEPARRGTRADRLSRQTARRKIRQSETTSTHTEKTVPPPQDSRPSPTYTHLELGTLSAADVANLPIDKKKKLFADIERDIRHGEKLPEIDAFLKLAEVQVAWSGYIKDTRPAYSMSVAEFLQLPDSERDAAFKLMRSDLNDLHFARSVDNFLTPCLKNNDFLVQWDYFMKTGGILSTDGTWVERELWAALGFSKPQGPFATEGLRRAKESKDLMTAVMKTLHHLRKQQTSRVLPWLENKQNRKVERAFDAYLRRLKGPERSNSRTDGTTRKMGTSRFTDKSRKYTDDRAAHLRSVVDELSARKATKKEKGGRWTVGDHQELEEAKSKEFWAKFGQTAHLASGFIYSYLSSSKSVNDLATEDKAKFLNGFINLLLDPSYSKQAQHELRDRRIVYPLEGAEYKVNQRPLRDAISDWANLTLTASKKAQVLQIISAVKNQGMLVITHV